MARMTPDEWRKKKEGTTGSVATPSVTSDATKSGVSSGRMTPSEWKEKKADTSVEWWAKTSISLLNEMERESKSWSYKDKHDSYSSRVSKLLSKADDWRKQYAGDSEAVSFIDSVVSDLTNAKRNSFGKQQFFSSFKDEEDYNFWDTHSTVEKRQAWYKELQDKIDALTAERKEIDPGIAHPAARMAVKNLHGDRLKEIDTEIEALKTEMRNYERGNVNKNGRFYGSKVDDDNYAVTQAADFAITSAKRDYKNPTKDDLAQFDAYSDSSTWQWGADGIYRDAYGNALEVDKSGNWVNPKAKGYEVGDKLGLFLNASDDDLVEAAGTTVGTEGTWASILKDGMDGSWKYLEEDEKGIYYTYLGESQGKAYQYLADMKTELNRRQTLDELGQWDKAYDDANLLEKIAMNVATVPAKFISNVAGSIENTANSLMGNDINPYSTAQGGMHYSQSVRGNTAEELDKSKFKIPLIDFTLGDIYQTGMSRIDSALATGIFGGGGTVFLGMGAAQEEAYKLYQQGASAEQITLGAFAAGAAEAVFEYASFDKLVKMGDADTIWKWVKSALVQGGIEASEETFTEISNIITNAVIMGQQSDLNALLEENGGDWGKVGIKLAQQVAHSAFGGFLGGIGAGVTEGGKSYINTQAQYAQTGNKIRTADGGAKALENLAMNVAGATEGKLSNSLKKQAGKVSGEVATGNGIGKIGAAVKNFGRDVQAGKLYNTVQTANKVANTEANQADIAKSLQRKGFNEETANDIASALVAQYNGKTMTKSQEKLLKSVEGNKVVRDAISNIVENVQSTMGQRQDNIRGFQNDITRGLVSKAITETIRKNTTAQQFTPTGEYEVSEKGKAINTETGDEIDIKGVSSISKGNLVLELADGTTIDAKSVSFASNNDALIYEAVANLGDNISAENANKLIAKYDGSKAEVFARGIAQAYTYGFYGIDRTELTGEHSLATELTKEQRNFAYGLGEQYRSVKDQADKGKARALKAPGEKGVYYRDKDGNATDIRSYLQKDGRVLNEMQTTGIEFMEKMSKMMGVRFNVFESWEENGTRYYLDENGEKTEGNPNGFYDPKTGEIYIDLFAGNDYQGTMLFTVAHELTHFMRQWSPEHFTKIAKLVFSHAGFKGSVSSLIADKMNGKRKLDYDTALEEVVADGMETILKDGKVAEFMADVKKTDSKVWAKLKEWFKNFAEFLKKMVDAYSGQSAQTVEGRKVADFSQKLLTQIEQIWAEGAVSAGENYQETVDGYKAEQNKFSTDTIRGNADGAVVQNEATASIVAKEQPRTEYEAFPKQMMNLSDGAGTIQDFIEGLTPTEVKGLSGKAINGYTGRDVRGYAMGISGFTQEQVNRVNQFMDTMADFMEKAGVTYKFIGLQDVENAQLHYTYNADGSIKSIVLSAMVKNGDYPVNFDLSSICKKRVAMSNLIDKLAKRGSLDNGTVKLTPANIFKINTALKDAGYETACLGCFVESKRYNSLEWAKKFCNKWNAAVKKVNPNATYFGYGDATFNEDSFTLEQAIKIDEAANKYITTTKTERMANALAIYKAREQAGLPLVVRNYKGVEYHDFSKAAKKRLAESDTISDELKEKYINCDTTTLNMADVEFLLENGILPGAALSNKQAVTEMVKSGEAYQHLLRPSDLLTDRGISKLEALPNFHGVLYGHYGSGTPKLMQSYTPYNSEIALLPSKKGDQSLAEYLYTIAGVRMQSFSDFQIQNIYDYLQMVGDLAARKVPAHAYTKEISFAKLLGMTGIKVNLSVMFDIDPMVDKAHAGLTKLNKLVHRGEYARVVLEDEQGKWVYNIGDYQTQRMFAEAFPDEAKRFLQSIGFADAVKLQTSTGYSANCGIIGVGYSDLGIFAMLDDNRIRYIIPYHASSLPAEIKLATNIALGTDYTPYQNNMKIKEIVDRNGKKVNWTIKEAYKRLGSGQAVINELNEKVRTEGWVVTTSKAQTGHGSYGLYENLQETNDPRQTASNFMDWCIGNSTLPLFYQFASHENYYKLLYDYNVYDCVTEEYTPQQAVTNTYPTMVDGQVQPGNVIDGGFDAEYFKGTIDKQMAFMNEYGRNLDEDLDALAENVEEGTLFSGRDTVKYAIRQQFYKDFDAWDGKNSNISFVVGTTSDALKSIGMKDQEIKMHTGMMLSKMNSHPEITRDIFRQVPELLEHPIIVQFSDAIDPVTQKPKYDDSITVLGELFAKVKENGKEVDKPVLVAINLVPTKKKSSVILDFAVVKSAYTKDALQQYLKENSILYIDPDKKRTDSWLTRTRLSLPVGVNNYGPIRKIAYVGGKVKVQNPITMTDMQRKLFEAGKIDEFGNKLFSERDNAPTFYSQMAKVVDGMKQEKFGASSVVSMLRGRGVKAEEIKWSGIEEWLQGKKSVTKAELQEFIAGSMLQIEEQMSGTSSYEDEDGNTYTEAEFKARAYELADEQGYDREDVTFNDFGAGMVAYVGNPIDENELLSAETTESSGRWSEYKLDGGENYREIVFTMPGATYTNRAMKAHWGQDAQGVLAHARVQDFDVNGSKMLFIEEIQSDWHNEGHSKGYESAEYKEAEKVSDDLFEKWRKIRQAMNQYARSSEFNTDPEDVRKKKWDWFRMREEEAYKKRQEADARLESLLKEGQGTTPDAPFRDTYHEFVLKRLLRMAAEEGYDSIGWTTADTQSERWSDEFAEGYRIEYDQDIPKFLRKYGKKWGASVGKTTLENALGKEDYTDDHGNAFSSIREWYDAVMDAYAEIDKDIWNRYVRGLTKVIQDGNTMRIQMKDTGEILEAALHITQDGVQVWSMDITPAMKESVMTEGQPLYSERSFPDNAEDIAREHFGTTTKWSETGWLMRDGTQLDFSGRHWERDPENEIDLGESYYSGKRNVEHYEIADAFPELREFSRMEYRGEHLDGFMKRGNIRIVGKGIIGLEKIPTEEQFEKLRSYFRENIDRGIVIGIGRDGMNFKEGTNPSIIIEGIRDYFSRNGRNQSELMRFHTMFSERSEDSVSNRSLLANAFEGIAKPEEQKKIQEYKEKVALINEEEKKLRELNEQIKELSFAKGKRDTKRINALRFDANQAANRINTYDKQLLRLEASKPLRDVLDREKKRAYQKAEQRGKEALADYKAKVEAKQKETTEKWRESRKTAVAKARETAEKRDARAKLQKLVLDTVNWLEYPAKTDVKCPDILKPFYKDFLESIDLSSKRLANGGDPTKADLRMASAMESLATALDRVMTSQDPTKDVDKVLDIGYLDLPAEFVKQLRDMTEAIKGMMVEGEYVVNNMTASEVRKLSQMIRTLNHAIKTMSNLYANLRFANVEALGFDTMDFLDTIGEIEKTGGVKDFVEWDNALPYYAFKRFGNGGESVFEGLMDAQDKLAFLAQEIFDFQEKTWTGEEAKAWSEDTHTIDLPNGNQLTLTTADAMSIYCLSRREQGLKHLLGGGTRVMGIQKGSQKAKDSRSLLTIEDISAINSSLTDRQRQVAEAMQEFMSTVCSDWGNEISMKRFLTKEFTEKFYFPIESNDENLPTKDPAAQQSDLFRLLNISATKPLTPGANNEVIIRNIFDVFVGHASDMARLNAFGMPLLDYMKWLNYREKTTTDEGQVTVRGVRKSMNTAYGNSAMGYVLNMIKDVNGRPSDGGLPNWFTRLTRNAKTAMVGSSFRVATLQMTSYPRAALVLSPKSLALGLSKKPNIKRAKEYCGIALWKSFGFYDTNISRSIEDQLKGVTNIQQKLIELSLKGAEIGDAITWGALWNACEYEVAQTTKNKVGSEEFYQEVGKKLREVVYRTQVVDSTLTRSQIMRSKNNLAQEVSSFMSEPTLSANILMDAGFEFGLEKRRTGSAKAAWAKTGSYIGRAIAVYSIGQLTAALLEGFWDAWRDDDDEEFWKKWLSAFGKNFALDLLPVNKIPIIADFAEAVLSLVNLGYFSSDRLSSTALAQTVSAFKTWFDVFKGDSSSTVYKALYESMRAASSFYGVSFSGAMREVVDVWNNTAGAFDSTLKIRKYDLSNTNLGTELYEAIVSGNTRQADSLKAQFDNEDSMNSAIRKALRENDPRIKEAAEARFSGDFTRYKEIFLEIKNEGRFSFDNIMGAVNAEVTALEKKANGGTSDETTKADESEALFKVEHYYTAVVGNDQASAKLIYDDLIAEKVAEGYLRHEAEDAIATGFATEVGKDYMDGKIGRDKALRLLEDNTDKGESDVKKWDFELKHGFSWGERVRKYRLGKLSESDLISAVMDIEGSTRAEAEAYIDFLDLEMANAEIDITANDADSYFKYAEPAGINIEVYLDYKSQVSGLKGDKDANGKTISGSKKAKQMSVINSLPITSAQKDALYLAEGWAESKLYEAPWH